MSKNLYIDASHPSEVRVVLKNENHIEDYEYESINNTLNKNNIYLIHLKDTQFHTPCKIV